MATVDLVFLIIMLFGSIGAVIGIYSIYRWLIRKNRMEIMKDQKEVLKRPNHPVSSD